MEKKNNKKFTPYHFFNEKSGVGFTPYHLFKQKGDKGFSAIEIKSSFRDPSGSLYLKGGVLYRKIFPVYKEHYEYAKSSGLYKALIDEKLLVAHYEKEPDIIIPQKIPFISYPYEWCFSQLKDAALLTLKIQKRALDFGMILKDGSAFNVQFFEGKPIFIDTLSFEKYQNGSSWLGYRQFCQHFLAPLVLMYYKDLRLNQLSRLFIDGFPLDLVSVILPKKTFLKPFILFHIHFHSKNQKSFAQNKTLPNWRMSKINLLALIDNLQASIENLNVFYKTTEWSDYYQKTNYSNKSFASKAEIINSFLEQISPKSVFDLGANTGEFSRLASNKGISTIAFDIDPMAVEKNYLNVKKQNEKNILPLVMDFTNPSPGIGWGNEERMTLSERGPADCVMALALLHHLAISNNVPFLKVADYFSRLGKHLIIEFVPKADSQVKKLLATRKDIFSNYDPFSFEKEFSQHFFIEEKKNIKDSERLLYLMKSKQNYD